MMSVVGAYSMGVNADNLIAWFDEYSDFTKQEACNNGTGSSSGCDLDESKGTAIGYDTLYHFLTIASASLVYFAVSIGAYIFAFTWGTITEPEDCESVFDALSASSKQQLQSLLQ